MYLKSILIAVIGVVVGIALYKIAEIISFRIKKRHRRKKDVGKGPGTKNKRIEFSKIVLGLVLATYFLGIYIGFKTVLLDFTQLTALLTFIGAPTTTAIGFYAWKAKAENIVKIKQAHPEETKDISVDLNNIIP